LLINQSLHHFWDQVFLYNFLYIDNQTVRFPALTILEAGYNELAPLSQLTVAAWLVAWVYIFFIPQRLGKTKPLVVLFLVYVPCEIGLTLVSGRSFLHYFTSWLPAVGIMTSFLLYIILLEFTSQEVQIKRARIAHKNIIVTLICVAILIVPLTHSLRKAQQTGIYFLKNLKFPYAGIPDEKEILTYIQTNTSEDEYVLMWGNEVSFNFISNRDAPTKYIYPEILKNETYATLSKSDEFIEDLQRTKPLIIVTRPIKFPAVCDPCGTSPLDQVRSFISTHYQEVTQIGPDNWVVYEFITE
jgi:hypothetical protein